MRVIIALVLVLGLSACSTIPTIATDFVLKPVVISTVTKEALEPLVEDKAKEIIEEETNNIGQIVIGSLLLLGLGRIFFGRH